VVDSGPDLLDRRCLFFTGKGGVGKSTMAAATALLAARTGRKVLLVEVDAKGDVPAQFEQKAVGFTPREVYPGVLAMAMDTEASLREYLRVSMRVPIIGKLGPLARVFDFVATAAPGVKEILTIGKIMWEVRESIEGRADHDIVIVDAAATGHIVSQLGAADAIQELVDVGPLRDQTRWLSELIADPHVTAVNVVTTPEEMPVTETIELVARLRAEVDVPLGAVIVNRVLPELFTHADEETFEALREPEASALLTERAGRGAVEVLDAARLAVSLRRTRAVHLNELRETVELPLLYVPYLFVRDHGLRVTRMVADALGAELGL
jgi:anion-transporting  ArsA/GET3 family ATPase